MRGPQGIPPDPRPDGCGGRARREGGWPNRNCGSTRNAVRETEWSRPRAHLDGREFIPAETEPYDVEILEIQCDERTAPQAREDTLGKFQVVESEPRCVGVEGDGVHAVE